MAKKTLLSENQIASFMKLANIRSEKVQNFKKRTLKESMNGMGGTGGMEMEEDESEAAEEMGDDMEMEMDMADEVEPEQPVGGTIEKESDELMDMIKNAVKDALAEAGLNSEEEGIEGIDMESEEMPEEEMDSEEEGEEEEEEEDQMEEYELQEAKKKAAKKARNLEGGDAKKLKESLAFSNVDIVTDEQIINEVLKRVIRRIL
jgi:hypothetical protein